MQSIGNKKKKKTPLTFVISKKHCESPFIFGMQRIYNRNVRAVMNE